MERPSPAPIFPACSFPVLISRRSDGPGKDFIRRLVERYRGHSALLCWDAWNEPRSYNECGCPASKASFYRWLEEKYSTIDNFNRIFGKKFDAFSSIPVHGCGACYSELFLWRQWAGHSVADRVKWVADIVRAEDPEHPVMTHCGWSSIASPSIRQDTNFDTNTRSVVDFYGTSFPVSGWMSQCYATGVPPEGYWVSGVETDRAYLGPMILDWISKSFHPAWVSELYSDTHAEWFPHFTEREIRLWGFLGLAHDIRGIFYWQFKPEDVGQESGGYGLVDRQGKDTPRSLAAGSINRFVARHRKLLELAKPVPPSVALLYDHRSDLLSDIERGGGNPFLPVYKTSVCHTYQLFWDMNIPVGFVNPAALNELENFPVLFLSYTPYLDRDLARSFSLMLNKAEH